MAIGELITDPSLQPLLSTSQSTLSRTLSILEWLEKNQTHVSSQDSQLELSRQQGKLHALLAKLRGQNRRAAFDVRATKQETAEARQEVDRLLLQLQNLYYEQRHLAGEISACEGYDHAYAQLPLLPLEQYFALFPEQASLSESELMPLRIAHEKEERESLEKQRLELVKVKEDLAKENMRKKEELRKMDERLEAVIDSLNPLEDTLASDL